MRFKKNKEIIMKPLWIAAAAAGILCFSSFVGAAEETDITSALPNETISVSEETNRSESAETLEAETESTEIKTAEKETTEEINVQAPKQISFDIAFTGGANRVTLGDTLWTEITFQNYGDEFVGEARWLFNGQPIEGFSNDRFAVYNGKTSAYPKLITDDFWDWGDISIGFELLLNGESFYKTERRVEICNTAYPQEKIDEVLAKVKPVQVEAWLNKNAVLYTSVSCNQKKGSIAAGTKVICTASKTDFSNCITLPDGSSAWVRVQDLTVSSKNYTKSDDLTNREKDIFVNSKGYQSETEYLVWVNLERQKVNVFKGKRGKWNIEGSFSCASGQNRTPTVTGEFKYYAKDNKWTYPGYYVGPCLIFSGNYALHSVLLSDNGGVYDGTLGRPASHGCVRLAKHHIDWLAENLPFGTSVIIY